ncbi:MAG: hypothetical protein LBQ27_01655 [Clostridiales bacterium]|jgi:hypothetical protein|nr:hypothetical protein [Clostridiales bacterium]
MRPKPNAEYADIYYNRHILGEKSYVSFCIQLCIFLGGGALAAIGIMPILSGQPLQIGGIIMAAAGGIPAITALVRGIIWIFYPRTLIAVEPGKVILFPRNKKGRELIIPLSDIIKIRLNDWWSPCFAYNNYSITLFFRHDSPIKIKYVKASPHVVSQLKHLKHS